MLPLFLVALSTTGIFISLYFLLGESKVAHSSKNKAICESCSEQVLAAVLNTPYSRSFGVRNYLLGMAFYIMVLASSFFMLSRPFLTLLLFASLASVIFSVYLAYALIFRIKVFCAMCFTSHIINLMIFLVFLQSWLQAAA